MTTNNVDNAGSSTESADLAVQEQDQATQGDPAGLAVAGKAALVIEREARKHAEEARKQAEIEMRRAIKDPLAAIAKILGVEPATGEAQDDLTTVKDQLEAMRLEIDVAKLARNKGITSDDDIALLSSIRDAGARMRLADRLAGVQGSAQQQDQAKKGTVRPDRNQGRNDEGASAKPSSVDAVRDQILAARANK